MLKLENFTDEDTKNIKDIPKRFKLYLFLMFILGMPCSFLAGLLGLLKKGHGFWHATIFTALMFAAVFFWLIIKEFIVYKQDINTKVKYSGTIIVTAKSVKKHSYVIFTDAKELKKISLIRKDVFYKIEVGNTLTIEISKFSKEVFRLEKDGENLLVPMEKL